MNSLLSCLLCAGLICAACEMSHAAEATVNLKVVSEDGAPVANADIAVVFEGYRLDLNHEINEKTDAEGRLKVSGWSKDPEFLLEIIARSMDKNYHMSRLATIVGLEADKAVNLKYDLVLPVRKKVNPIPLYARHLCVGVPVHEEWAGYDLIMADWLPPHGQGKEADLWMFTKIQSDGKGSGSGSLKIKFAEGGGLCLVEKGMIKESEMKMPHQAAETGYQPLYEREASSYLDPNRRDGIGYFLRSRVKLQDGKLLAANYGKITEDIQFDPRQSGWHVSDEGKPTTYGTVSLIYYFNPTPNDRNLEFDPKKNLFESLDPLEEVHAP